MKNFLDYVDEAREKLGLESDSALSKHLGGEKNRSLVSQWRNSGNAPEDYYCILIAEILEIDPLEVIASAQYSRAKDEDRKVWWENFSKQHVKTMAAVLIACSVFLGFGGAGTAEKAAVVVAVFCLLMSSYNVYYVKLRSAKKSIQGCTASVYPRTIHAVAGSHFAQTGSQSIGKSPFRPGSRAPSPVA